MTSPAESAYDVLDHAPKGLTTDLLTDLIARHTGSTEPAAVAGAVLRLLTGDDDDPGVLDRYELSVSSGHPPLVCWCCRPCRHIGTIVRDLEGSQKGLTPAEIVAGILNHEAEAHGAPRQADPVGQQLAAAEELHDLRALFDVQTTRMEAATARWRAEDPAGRAHTMPDLGALLQWLMDQADAARQEPHGVAVVSFGSGSDSPCSLPRCPMGEAPWFPNRDAAAAYAATLPAAFEPHFLLMRPGVTEHEPRPAVHSGTENTQEA